MKQSRCCLGSKCYSFKSGQRRTNTDLALPFSLAAVSTLPCFPPLPPHFICILASSSCAGFISSHSRAVIVIEVREVCIACRLEEQATGFTHIHFFPDPSVNALTRVLYAVGYFQQYTTTLSRDVTTLQLAYKLQCPWL